LINITYLRDALSKGQVINEAETPIPLTNTFAKMHELERASSVERL